MNAFQKAVKDQDLRKPEPQDYQKQYLSPDKEKAFEEWTKRLVPCIGRKPF